MFFIQSTIHISVNYMSCTFDHNLCSYLYRPLRERPLIAQPVDAIQMRRENDSTPSQVPLLPETPGDQGGKVMDRLMN